ncbi:hypothetical protein HJC23_009058 [Cyclotella cryptica]|uniref:Uncharacterized protein n=1 Tax=Cyclotella cryptica TaxID=29204 RepID=A0ABD3R017_9STRA|eukprot:CCRYP_000667-RA/>CCRYP_000667-RA protein AED:0.34 eAED:0.34 QI:263/1/1/1/1/1/2/286/344
MMKCTAVLLAVLLPSQPIAAQKSASGSTAASTSRKPLQFTSPLQSFTIFDKAAAPSAASPRAKFLPRLRAGLLAERRARELIAAELRQGALAESSLDLDHGGWAEHSALEEERRKKAMERRVEAAYDEAVKAYDAKMAKREQARAGSLAAASTAASGYQFVGVINGPSSNTGAAKSSDKVTWYARKKPHNSKWNVRLIHVNQDAVLKDLFVKGKIDLYAGYNNEGMDVVGGAQLQGEEGGESAMRPLVSARYRVRERSWRTLWNFSPVRLFTQPSGSYHRERRLTPGLYTDGTNVYEPVYRYRDGKNGMKPVGKLDKYVKSLGGDAEERVREKLSGVPDVVVEK